MIKFIYKLIFGEDLDKSRERYTEIIESNQKYEVGYDYVKVIEEDLRKQFVSFLYKNKHIERYWIIDEYMDLMLGFYNVDYIDEIFNYDLSYRDDIKLYWYTDLENFKLQINPIIDKFKKEKI